MDVSKRLVSLDVFRGITIAGMILVNNPGSWSDVYAPLLHAKWHGATPTDWIFPFFLFIVGVAIPLSIGKQIEREIPKKKIILKIVRRSLTIFAIGLFLNLFPLFQFGTVRIPGVLQRIALVYFAAALIFYYFKPRYILAISLGILLIYWILMSLVPVPGGIGPNLEPDTNLGAFLDRWLMSGHLWSASKTWDPEGLLSTLPAVVTGLSGVLCGKFLRSSRTHFEKVTIIMVAGVLLLALGLIWNPAFPINKALWTSSYVLYTSGIALLFLGVVYYFIDIAGYKKWASPFKVYGMNALFVFVLSGIFAKSLYYIKWTSAEGEVTTLKSWIYHAFFTPFFEAKNASLAFAVFNVLLFLLLSWLLYRKRIFIKV